ncbi:MAG: acetyl-CoA carboxylase biotin carboxyl carrier protein subunit [Bacteroidota bacterium]
MKNYQVATGDRVYDVTADQLAGLDLIQTGPNTYHLLQGGHSYHLQLIQLDLDAKQLHLQINGRDHHLKLRDEVDQLVDALGFAAAAAQTSKDVFAPMPGLVLDVMVAPGDTVTAGMPLLILEAMKMENVLKAEGDGTVKEVSVAKGEAVEKKQLLIQID